MPTSTEIFINSELPKRPYTNQFPLTAGHIPVATGNGLEVEGRILDVSDITNAASEQYVNDAISNLIDNSPGALDTLNELAAALGDDPNFASTVSTALSNRLRVDINTQGLTLTEKQNGLDNLGITEVITDASMNASGLITFAKNTGQTADTVQIPTAISGLSFNSSTGVLTSSYTNGAIDTTITVAANEVADNVFRIKDNVDSTKKIAFEASAVGTGQTRTITMPNANVDLGLVGQTDFLDTAFRISDNTDVTKKIAFDAAYVGSGTTKTITMPNRDINLDGIPFVNDGAGSLGITNNQVNYLLLQQGVFACSLPITYASTGTSTIFVLKSNSVSSAPIFVNFTWSGQSGGFTLSPQVGYSDQSIATTFLEDGPFTPLVISGANGNKIFQIGTLAPGGSAIISVSQNGSGNFGLKVAYIDGQKLGANNSNLKICKNLSNEGIATTINAASLTAANTLTLADKDVNLGDLPSVATTNSNILGGATSTITGGTFNNVSGNYSNITGGTNSTVSDSNSSIVASHRCSITSTGGNNRVVGCIGGSFVKGADISGTASKNIIVGAIATPDTSSGIFVYDSANNNCVFGSRSTFTQSLKLRGTTTRCTIIGAGAGTDLNNCADSALIGLGGSGFSETTWTSTLNVGQIFGGIPVSLPANNSSYYGVGTASFGYSSEYIIYNSTTGTNVLLTTNGSATLSTNNTPNISNEINDYEINIWIISDISRVAYCKRKVFINKSFAFGDFIQVDTIGTDITWSGHIPTVNITIDSGTGRLKVECSATTAGLVALTDLTCKAFVSHKSF